MWLCLFILNKHFCPGYTLKAACLWWSFNLIVNFISCVIFCLSLFCFAWTVLCYVLLEHCQGLLKSIFCRMICYEFFLYNVKFVDSVYITTTYILHMGVLTHGRALKLPLMSSSFSGIGLNRYFTWYFKFCNIGHLWMFNLHIHRELYFTL